VAKDARKLVVIGKTVGTFGIKGELKISPYTESPDVFYQCDELFLNGISFTVTRIRPHKRALLVALEGIDAPEPAREQVGKLVAIPRESLPPCEEDEYYWTDLIGMNVTTTAGVDLGTVDTIIRTGAHDVLVIWGDRGEVLIPMIDHMVPTVSTERNTIEVDPPEGLVPDA
jgi:16S rRNA processing protein RimM